ncbi:hypothetical protein SELMODRAFT_137944 [Selaginella moellendorffii]|uniref:Barwin domain-containing protein n=1 Tax=Selaginella moellendorffii TaxID=88036 RepID=D8TED1_SELML|nr:hypothetical protein SELMODRAFT_137944 [Selaginella moellendorffii]
MAALSSHFLEAILFLSLFLLAPRGQAQVYTTYNQYDPAAKNYQLDGLYCATYSAHQPLSWRSQYKWTAMDASLGMGPQMCGQCLEVVTNIATGAQIVVRVLDQSSNGGLDLETDAFNTIDTDGGGYASGHLYTSYTSFSC